VLVLSRRNKQSIIIGEDIEISVLEITRDKVRIGIVAPRVVPVFRKEVWLDRQGPGAGNHRRELEDALSRIQSG
jgi:carbon storage regulator